MLLFPSVFTVAFRYSLALLHRNQDCCFPAQITNTLRIKY